MSVYILIYVLSGLYSMASLSLPVAACNALVEPCFLSKC